MTIHESSSWRRAAVLAAASLCLSTAARAQERAPLPWAPAPLEAAPPPAPGAWPIQLDGLFWVDTGYLNRDNRQPGLPNQQNEYMSGRFVLGAVHQRTVGGLTAKARVELLGLVEDYADGKYGEPHVQDAYVQLGDARWDVQVGRLLAQEVYYRGQGIELYTAEEAGAAGGPVLYLVDFNRGYKNGPGQVAVHYYPADLLSLELAGTYGFETQQNNLGIRPLVDLHRGGLQLVAAWEYLKQTPVQTGDKVEATSQGYGARLQYRLPVLTAGVDFAQAKVDATGIDGLVDAAKSFDKTSLGGWADVDLWRGSLGLGYHFTTQKSVKGETDKHHQFFVSWLQRLPIDGLSLKAVYGYALAQLEDVDAHSRYENALNSVRVRVLYEFR